MGAPFRFRLERVRALREREEELAQLELAVAIGKLKDSESRLQAVDANLAQAQEQQRCAAGGSVNATDLLAHQAFLEQVERQRRLGIQDMERSAGEVADRGAALGRAAREHEMIERLKARRHSEHTREWERREGADLDEIAINRHHARTG